MEHQAVVIDNGTGYTKMGYAGNLDPDFVIPTSIADLDKKTNLSVSTKNDEYNYYIGDAAINKAKESKVHKLVYPMQNGIIESWDLMEKFWHQSIYNYLKCDPQEHNFVLTEPPMNPPENRENIAEIFFETFNVPGLYIGVQAVFALLGCSKIHIDSGKAMDPEQKKAVDSLTGVVVDSGDGVTHIVPICDGFVLGSNIKHIPIAGRKITKFMEQMIRDRNEKINTEDLYYATMEIKEKYGYLAKDLVEEFAKFDQKGGSGGKLTQSAKFKKIEGIGKISSKPYSINVGYELFLGPESFFSPEIIDKNFKASLDETIDITIQQCPIDYRRRLYADIVFSGGSTSFRNLDKRLEMCLQKRVDDRLKKYTAPGKKSSVTVKVTNSMTQKHVVWLGGSSFSAGPHFKSSCHTRAEYQEKGPSCCRFNPVFSF
jgi:actin-related protein 3